MSNHWIDAIVTAVAILTVVGLFTNGFGIFDRTYKGIWVTVKHESMPAVMKKINEAQGFLDADGMYKDLEMSVSYELDYAYVYRIKLPKHVFHNVEYAVILKELGIK